MKQYSGVDIRKWIIQNEKIIKTSRISQIYRQGISQLCIALSTLEGKKYLIINPPNFIILTDKKPSADHKDTGFGRWMRNNLKGAIIQNISQINSERIIEFKFMKGYMYLELFNKGNLIITDKDKQIQLTLQKQMFKDRNLVRNEEYKLPISFNTFGSNVEDWTNHINNIIKENEKTITTSKFFATNCHLGGDVSKQLCDLIKVKHDDELKILLGKEKNIIKEVTKITKEVKDFSGYETEFFSKETDASQTAYDKKLNKVNSIIKKQKETLTKAKKNIDKQTEYGEFIYNNYQFFDELKQAFEFANENNKEFNDEIIKKIKQKHNIKIKIKYKRPEIMFEI